MKRFEIPSVERVFGAHPPELRKRLMRLRQLIFDVAARTDGVGPLEETLKWGEPAYVTTQSKSGSTIRIDRKRGDRPRYAIDFNCQTTLVDTFRTLFPEELEFEGNRAIVFDQSGRVPVKVLSACIGMALTYRCEQAKLKAQLRSRTKKSAVWADCPVPAVPVRVRVK
jgi:hypothetical protein